VSTGHLLFMRADALWPVRFDLDQREIEGQPVPVLERVRAESNSGYGQLAVSDDGTLVYLPSGFDERALRVFVWVSRDGSVERLATESRDHRAFDLSPDGSRIAASTDTDIWVYDLLTGASSRLTFGPERSSGPTWMPDGGRVAYTAANLPLS
jgi:Tol biopolymer transport system component